MQTLDRFNDLVSQEFAPEQTPEGKKKAVGENYEPVEYHIKNFIVTGKDLPPLLTELENVQDPEHWKYQGWASEKILQQ